MEVGDGCVCRVLCSLRVIGAEQVKNEFKFKFSGNVYSQRPLNEAGNGTFYWHSSLSLVAATVGPV